MHVVELLLHALHPIPVVPFMVQSPLISMGSCTYFMDTTQLGEDDKVGEEGIREEGWSCTGGGWWWTLLLPLVHFRQSALTTDFYFIWSNHWKHFKVASVGPVDLMEDKETLWSSATSNCRWIYGNSDRTTRKLKKIRFEDVKLIEKFIHWNLTLIKTQIEQENKKNKKTCKQSSQKTG